MPRLRGWWRLATLGRARAMIAREDSPYGLQKACPLQPTDYLARRIIRQTSTFFDVTLGVFSAKIAVIISWRFEGMQLVIITNCSARKTATPVPALCARSLPRGTPEELAAAWRDRVASADSRVRVHQLYSGRNFSIAHKVAKSCGAELRVLSAGMGLIKPNAAVPPYDLTISKGERDCILGRAPRRQFFSAQQWWQVIRAKKPGISPFARLLAAYPRALLAIAVSRPYLTMIAGELSGLHTGARKRVRILGPTEARIVPKTLRSCVMPYDSRLNDQTSSLRGTAFDFPSRALAHFANLLESDRRIESPASHARRVRQSLARRTAPTTKSRLRIDGATLGRRVWALKLKGFSRTAALQYLRRELGLACEQQRFAAAWAST